MFKLMRQSMKKLKNLQQSAIIGAKPNKLGTKWSMEFMRIIQKQNKKLLKTTKKISEK